MVSVWKLRATGSPGSMVADPDEVRRAAQLFLDPENAVELRALTTGVHRVVSGDDLEGVVKTAQDFPAGIGVYFVLNPVRCGQTQPTKEKDVLKRRWLYVDVDPVKLEEHKDSPATDLEKSNAGQVCDSVNEYLSDLGWPAPVIVDSGNGYAMYWKTDLPADSVVKATYQRLLVALSDKFTGELGKIDKAVHNASRLVKLPGTWSKKGKQSDDRPYRPCKVVYVPSKLDSVTFEQLASAAGVEGKKEPKKEYHVLQNGQAAPYGRKALDGECSRVVFATERNNALNRAAFSLGQLVAGKVLEEEEVVQRLTDAARQSGLDRDPGCGENGIAKTIASGMKAGKESPRAPEPRREPKPVLGKAEFIKAVKDGEKRLTVALSAVKPLQVDWLVPGRIPKRFITVFAGRTGVGKSFVACDLIARLTAGEEIPGCKGQCFEPGGALIISEDSHEYVLAPRLITLGAKLERVHAMTWEAMGNYHLSDTDMLEQACKEVDGGVSLVMIDPPTNFLDDVDEHKNSEVRQLVMKVVEWCFRHDLACLFVLHINKQTGKGIEAVNRVMGSVAWVSTARIAHSFCLDPDDTSRGLWMPTKSNLGPLPKGLAYRIMDGSIEWLGEVEMTADEALGGETKTRRRGVVAAEWLVERFREKREWPSDELFEAARQENLSKNSIYEAKDSLHLPKARQDYLENGNRRWVWWVPQDWPPLSRDD